MSALDVKSFRDLTYGARLLSWSCDCYRLADTLPPSERFGLVAQIKRCATSIPANIAEGHASEETKAFLEHVNIALGSEAELATHLHVSVRLNLCSEKQTCALCQRREHVGRMLNRLAAALQRKVESEATARGSIAPP